MYVCICREWESIAAIIMAPKDVCALIFRTGEYVTLHGRWLRLKTVRRRDYVRLLGWSQGNHTSP